jgi:hypothetical protein
MRFEELKPKDIELIKKTYLNKNDTSWEKRAIQLGDLFNVSERTIRRWVVEKLSLKERSIIGPSQRDNISWFRVSPWWTKTSMKRSLFTALLRCGQNYNSKIDNFEEALLSVLYIKHTEYAVRRFLDGHTKYTGKRKGWYNQFRWGGGPYSDPKMPTKDQIDKLLVRPTERNFKKLELYKLSQ